MVQVIEQKHSVCRVTEPGQSTLREASRSSNYSKFLFFTKSLQIGAKPDTYPWVYVGLSCWYSKPLGNSVVEEILTPHEGPTRVAGLVDCKWHDTLWAINTTTSTKIKKLRGGKNLKLRSTVSGVFRNLWDSNRGIFSHYSK